MKKMLLSAAAFAVVAVSAIAVAPTTSEAIPAFARQTGAACLSCHFQEVPALGAFGRAFKEGSFTQVGDEALVEDDNLSIPAVVNLSFVVRGQAFHDNNGGTTGTASQTYYQIPTDQNFMLAGRVGTHTGVFLEFAGGTGDTGNGGLNNMQVLNSFDVGNFKVGLSYSDTSFGADSTLAVNSVYGQHSGNIGDLGGDISAVNNSGFNNSMTTIGTWIGNDLGFIQVGVAIPGGAAGWTVAGAADSGINATNNGTQYNVGAQMAKFVKVAATFNFGNFDTIVGVGIMGGKIAKGSQGTGVNNVQSSMNMQWAYGQMQGTINDMQAALYADYAHAKGTAGGNLMGAQDLAGVLGGGGNPNVGANSLFTTYNALTGNQKFNAFSIRGTLKPITGLTFGLGYGYRDTSGSAVGFNNPKHKIVGLSAGYQFYQNMIVSLKYTNDQVSGMITPANNRTIRTTFLDYVIYM